jgi:hypothetical protein
VHLQVTQTGDNKWHVEAHNPTDGPLTVTLSPNPFFDPLRNKGIKPETLQIPAGSSVWREF